MKKSNDKKVNKEDLLEKMRKGLSCLEGLNKDEIEELKEQNKLSMAFLFGLAKCKAEEHEKILSLYKECLELNINGEDKTNIEKIGGMLVVQNMLKERMKKGLPTSIEKIDQKPVVKKNREEQSKKGLIQDEKKHSLTFIEQIGQKLVVKNIEEQTKKDLNQKEKKHSLSIIGKTSQKPDVQKIEEQTKKDLKQEKNYLFSFVEKTTQKPVKKIEEQLKKSLNDQNQTMHLPTSQTKESLQFFSPENLYGTLLKQLQKVSPGIWLELYTEYSTADQHTFKKF